MSATASNPSTGKTDESPFLTEWGFSLKELYNLSLQFYKEKTGKAVNFTYEENVKLVGLTMQVSHGKYDVNTAPPVGALDMIGKDRQIAWQALKDKSKFDCMFEFVFTLDKKCPLFKPYVEAHRTATKTHNRVNGANTSINLTEGEQELLQLSKQEEEAKERSEEQKRSIQDALNSQTFSQFKSYAEQQFPGNPEQQGVLIRQLQEQHYEQYMRQIYQHQFFQNEIKKTNRTQTSVSDTNSSSDAEHSPRKDLPLTSANNSSTEKDDTVTENTGEEEESGEDPSKKDENDSSPAAASMWTRKDVKEFKESVKSEGGEAILRIGQGESVTVRVPTHKDGTCLFWEFATDFYDIGFGLFFEWTDADEPVSVQVTEETTDDEEEEDDEAFAALQEDVEKGRELLPKGAKPNTEVIIPVFRRDSHQEVYVGSHLFPGKGVYLLKFDNSYSFWRSKTLYYRVYYTK